MGIWNALLDRLPSQSADGIKKDEGPREAMETATVPVKGKAGP